MAEPDRVGELGGADIGACLQRGVVDHQHGGRRARRQARQVRDDALLRGALQVRVDGADDAPRLRLLLVQALGQQGRGQRRAQRTRDHRLDRRITYLHGAPHTEIAHAPQYLVARGTCSVGMTIRAQPARRLRQHRQQRRLGARQLAGRLAQVRPRRRLDAFDRTTERRMVEIQVEDLRLAQVRLQLQRAEHLHELAVEGMRDRLNDPRHLHGQRGTARDDAAVAKAAGETTQQRIRIHAGMAVEPAVLVGQQRPQVQRRHLLRGGRVTPHAVAVGKRAQRRAVARQHHRAAGVGRGQAQREQPVEQQRRNQQRGNADDAVAQPAPCT